MKAVPDANPRARETRSTSFDTRSENLIESLRHLTDAGIEGVTHQMLRRTCSTYMAQITSVKDVQAHLRHTNAKTTLKRYIKSVPESVRVAVESLDQLLKKKPSRSETPAN